MLFSVYFVSAQTFSPDRNGYVEDTKFRQLIKSRGYELVGTFDTIQRKPLVVAARFQQGGKWGMINNYGKVIREVTFVNNSNTPGNQGSSGPSTLSYRVPSEESAAKLRKIPYCTYSLNGKYGTKDTTGKTGIPPVYDRIFLIDGRLAVVVLDKLSGLYRASGEELVPVKYDNVSYSPKGRPIYIVKKGTSYGVLGVGGKELIPISYDGISYSENPGYLKLRKGALWGICDSTGKTIIPVEYDNVSNYSAGDVFTVKKATFYGAFDIKGKNNLPVEYNAITSYNNRYQNFIVKKGTGFGVVTAKNEQIIPLQYEMISPDNKYKSLLKVTSGKKIALFTANGQQLTDFVYDLIVGFNTRGLAEFKKGDAPNVKMGVMDTLGKERVPAIYDEIGFLTPNILKVYAGKYPDVKIKLTDWEGNAISQAEYSQVDNFIKGLAKVAVGKYPDRKFGYVDSSGNEVVKPKYANVEFFDRIGLFVVKVNRQFGIINKKDEMIVQPIYDQLLSNAYSSQFISGVRGKFGLLDKQGKVLVPPAYDDIRQIGQQYYLVTLNQKQGILNNEGKLVVPVKYDKFLDGDNYTVIDHGILKAELDGSRRAVDLYGNEYQKPGEAIANYNFIPDKEGYVNSPDFQQFVKLRGFQLISAFDTMQRNPLVLAARVMVDGKWKFIDTKGKFISPTGRSNPYIPVDVVLTPDVKGDPNADIMISTPVEPGGDNKGRPVFEIVQTNGKYGTLDKTHNKQGLRPEYDQVNYMDNDWASITKDGKYGLAKLDGSFTIAPKYQDIRPAEYGGKFTRKYFIIKSGDKYGLLSETGSETIAPKYDLLLSCYAFDQSGQLLRFTVDNKWGLITKQGKVLAEPVYDQLDILSKNIMRTLVGSKRYNGKYGLLDTTGKVVLEPVYSRIDVDFGNKNIRIETRSGDIERHGIMDMNGKMLLEPVYEEIMELRPGLLRVKLDGKYGVIDPTGRFVLKAKYAWLYTIENAREIAVNEDGKHGVLDMKGGVVIPVVYEELYQAGNSYIIKKDGKWGMMNKQQKVLATYNYDSVFPGYRCLIVERNAKFGLITMDGKLITSIKYDQFRDKERTMRDGLAEVELNGRRGVIDHYGNEYLGAER